MSFDSVKVEKLREFVSALENGEIEGGEKLASRIRLQIVWLDGKIEEEEKQTTG